ncbi:MAG TPA: AmmeMemoRadiSam system protein B [Candidatus Binatia bacterium]|nr:AmmeMemoRadiSam system protein B [Candidatus Binatia bacterium]
MAGSFYPADAEELSDLLQKCFDSHPLGPKGTRSPSASLVGGMAPHAGYAYSGPCAAHLYSRVDESASLAIVVGVNHRARGARAALSPAEFWQTPLGRIPVDREAGARLLDEVDFLTADERAHREEHSIEVQLPFLQTVLDEFTLVPIALAHVSEDECLRLGEALARLYEARSAAGQKVVVVASSDLNHYLSPAETERLDGLALEKILALDAPGLLHTVAENRITMCGVAPTTAVLFAATALGAKTPRLLKHCHSGDAKPMREVVGYASVAVEV